MSAEEMKSPPRPEEMWLLPVRQFVAATAARLPIPGGGSVAGVVGGLATALAEMELAFTRGKKKFAAHAASHEGLAVRLARARGMFADLTADDAAAYSLYQEAARCTDESKPAKEAAALAAAINVPREMTAVALSVLEDMKGLCGNCNEYLLTDLAAGAVLAEAAVRLCDYNVRVNAKNHPDAAVADELRAASARDCARAAELRAAVEKFVGTFV